MRISVSEESNLENNVQIAAKNIRFEDISLVEKARQGSSEAMDRLIVKYQGRIYNTILRICANPDDAAELTQDAFVKVLEKINDFRGQSSFYTWLFRIAVNLTLNYCKRRKKLAIRSLDEQKQGQEYEAAVQLKSFLADDSSPDPAELAEKKELCELVYIALARLDDSQRAVVVLRDIEGMNYSQISETLDIELGTVKSRLSRARDNLRKIFRAVLK